jgi:Htaa protein
VRSRERLAAVLAAVAVALLAAPALAADDTTPTGPVTLSTATLRWGINNESSNRAYAPDTYNFFSAGRVPDPGAGGRTITEPAWSASSGAVRIEKWDGTAWKPATWAGLSTDSSGTPLGAPTAGTFSNHSFVFSGGTGTVDVAAGTAHVAWDGDLTVLYYSGMSLFYVSDPVLDVASGKGTVTATVSGFASSVDDPTRWAPVAPAQVTLADLPSVTLGATGLTTTPAYGDVATGSFPSSFVDYMDKLGTAAFWKASGAATDPFKVPLPLSVGYDEEAAAPTPTPSAAPTRTPTPVDNPIVKPPKPTATVTVTARPAPVPVPPPAPAPPTAAAVPAAPAAQLPAATQLVAVRSEVAPTGHDEPAVGSVRLWWAGGVLLLLAALLLAVPSFPRNRKAAP